MVHLVKNLPAMWETCVRCLGEEDLPEKASILAWISGESHGLYSPWSHKESDTTSLSMMRCQLTVRILKYLLSCMYSSEYLVNMDKEMLQHPLQAIMQGLAERICKSEKVEMT